MVRGARFYEDPELAANRQTASLAALALLLALVTGGLFVIDALRSTAALQDCVLAGRRDCPAASVARLAHPFQAN